ncbi:Polynucleotide 5'-hydroxyl-kinase grc3 [Tulasnella sp. JGI-2019a]|nr:Polynucleotide 5'-hydroxyl-kinase grc3 [Tulasnella sp. JGI-2019a]
MGKKLERDDSGNVVFVGGSVECCSKTSMLSAVAARKAQQQQLTESHSRTKSGPKAQVLSSRTGSVLSESNPPPPISVSLQNADPPLKRKRRRGPLKPPERVQRNDCSDIIYEPEVVVAGAGPSSETPRMSKIPRRAWSPSQPMVEVMDECNESDKDVDMPSGGENADDLLVMNAASSVSGNWRASSLQGNVLSSFEPKLGENVFPSLVEGGTVVILELEDTLCFMGSVSLTVIHGTVEVFGSTLSKSSRAHSIYAPRCAPLPILSCSTSLVAPTTTGLLHEVSKRLQASNSAVLLRPLSTGVEGLGNVCSTFEGVFGDDAFANETDDIFLVKGFKLIHLAAGNLQPFRFTPEWRTAVDEIALISNGSSPSISVIHKPMVVMVKGPKGTGKSTFARTLLNRLCCRYRQVAFLDCDLGQSEFSPGGMVSLHAVSRPLFGPPFTHPRRPYASHYIGSLSPRSAPSQYIASVAALLQTYRLDLQCAMAEVGVDQDVDEHLSSDITPLIINTQGWTKGLGADLMRAIEDVVQPTHVFEFAGEDRTAPSEGLTPSRERQHRRAAAFDVPGITQWAGEYLSMMSTPFVERQAPKVWTLPPAPAGPLANLFTAADMRAINLMSYFHQQHAVDGPTWRTDTSLLARPPYEVNINVAFDAVVLTGPGSEDVVFEEVLRALNCSVVALVEDENSKDFFGTGQSGAIGGDHFPYMQGAPPPDPSTSRCHGLAFIRGISTSTIPESSSSLGVSVHMLTPIPPEILSRCRVVVKGEMEMPIWAFIGSSSDPEQGCEWKGTGRKGETGGGMVCGVPWENVPHLAFRGGRESPSAAVVGSGVRRARKNVMRRSQL